jgi:hypothetical protein
MNAILEFNQDVLFVNGCQTCHIHKNVLAARGFPDSVIHWFFVQPDFTEFCLVRNAEANGKTLFDLPFSRIPAYNFDPAFVRRFSVRRQVFNKAVDVSPYFITRSAPFPCRIPTGSDGSQEIAAEKAVWEARKIFPGVSSFSQLEQGPNDAFSALPSVIRRVEKMVDFQPENK